MTIAKGFFYDFILQIEIKTIKYSPKTNDMNNTHLPKLSMNYKRIPKSFIRELLTVADQKNMISFAGGLPNPDYFPIEDLKASAQHVFTNHGNSLLQYAGSQGYLPLREWIANRYSEKFNCSISPGHIVITNGSQQTLDVVAKMFIDKGDGVIVEKPTYLGGIQAFSAYSPEFLEVDLKNDGPDLEQIERHCLNHVPKFMYGIPNFQNPSGICYSEEKRNKLAMILKSYNLIFLEDDPYHEIRFKGEDLTPLFRYAPGQVIWTGSFSKMVAPGFRMGWALLPEHLISPFIRAKQSTDLHSNNLSQYILHHYLSTNNIDLHLQKVRKAYNKQCYFMLKMIRAHFPNSVKTTTPEGGMFIWLTLPKHINSEELIISCLDKGVAFVPGTSFFTSPNGTQNIRMNFSNSSFDKIEKGINIMAAEMKKVKDQKVSYLL